MYKCVCLLQDVSRRAGESSRRMMRAVDWPAAVEQPRPGPQSALPPGSPRAADAAAGSMDDLDCGPGGGSGCFAAYPKEVAEAQAGRREEHSGNPQGFAAVWPRALRAARQLSVWPLSVCLAIQDWTERFWQVCSFFTSINMCHTYQYPVKHLTRSTNEHLSGAATCCTVCVQMSTALFRRARYGHVSQTVFEQGHQPLQIVCCADGKPCSVMCM